MLKPKLRTLCFAFALFGLLACASCACPQHYRITLVQEGGEVVLAFEHRVRTVRRASVVVEWYDQGELIGVFEVCPRTVKDGDSISRIARDVLHRGTLETERSVDSVDADSLTARADTICVEIIGSRALLFGCGARSGESTWETVAEHSGSQRKG